MRNLKALLLLLLCAVHHPGEAAENPALYPLLYFGQALLADPSRLEVRRVGELSAAAPALAADPQGLLWGRLEPRHLGALDPVRGDLCARVELPRRPYNHLITPSGKAYVTHAALTREGFTLSVVDTKRRVLLREITGITGLRTDLAQAAGYVFLAAQGVGPENRRHSYLYQIEEATDRLREALHAPATGFHWKLAAAGERLYLGYLPDRDTSSSGDSAAESTAGSTAGSAAFGRVEAREARTLAVLGSWAKAPGPLRTLFATTERVLLFFEDEQGNTELRVLDPLLGGELQAAVLQGPVARVLGLQGRVLTYLDYPFELGYTRVHVCFYDLESGKELKRVDVGGQR